MPELSLAPAWRRNGYVAALVATRYSLLAAVGGTPESVEELPAGVRLRIDAAAETPSLPRRYQDDSSGWLVDALLARLAIPITVVQL